MLPPLVINHVNIPAQDPALLRAWYCEKLGFSSHGAFLWSGGSLLVFVKGEQLRGDHHFGFRLPTIEALHGWVAALRERGVEVGEVQGDETYSTVYVQDPEGNVFELFYEPMP
ncbi:MAG: VOC family protein [Planctomycetes bacterium]|nr:VOC family protein [Planctomycetota bacterium]MCW8141108.1 VOC family protein [Planctomycetota bacterium]